MDGNFYTVAACPGSGVLYVESIASRGDVQHSCYRFSRFDYEGRRLCQADFGWNAELCGSDETGLWFAVPVYDQTRGPDPGYDLIRTNLELKELGRVRMPGLTVCETSFLKKHSLAVHTCFLEGLWLVNEQDMTVRACLTDKRAYTFLGLDGAGRIWTSVGGSTLEAYDLDLNLLSRHRLKGGLLEGSAPDSERRLCVRTYDMRRHILRVYRFV